jgi:DNA-3-methyladenine glycosylase I
LAQFNVDQVAKFTTDDVSRLMLDSGIIRNRLKIESVISNARLVKDIQREFGSFNDYMWSYVDHVPMVNQWLDQKDIPATTLISDRISRDMKKRGFRFFGSTICYAYMQAMGMANDHQKECFNCPAGL